MGKMHDKLRRGADTGAADHGPIEPGMSAQMNAIALALDEMLNGKDCPVEDKQVGFFLTCFRFGEPDGSRFNYISNAQRLDVIATLKDVLARLEGRHTGDTSSVN